MNPVEENYIDEENRRDNSFKEGNTFLSLLLRPFGASYKEKDMRETWLKGKKWGFEMGLHYSKPERRIEQLSNNIKNKNHKEFYDKFLDICKEHNVRISYHPTEGMMFEELIKPNKYENNRRNN